MTPVPAHFDIQKQWRRLLFVLLLYLGADLLVTHGAELLPASAYQGQCIPGQRYLSEADREMGVILWDEDEEASSSTVGKPEG